MPDWFRLYAFFVLLLLSTSGRCSQGVEHQHPQRPPGAGAAASHTQQTHTTADSGSARCVVSKSCLSLSTVQCVMQAD